MRASDDVSFEDKPVAPTAATGARRRVRFYRNPMGLPDTSPVPKKDSMGMDYVPVYEDEGADGSTVAISPGKLQHGAAAPLTSNAWRERADGSPILAWTTTPSPR